MHILNWRKITETYLKKQLKTDETSSGNHTVNKGILFEDIIEKLLAAMFPEETWRRTSKSHDGKKDFIYSAEEYLNEQKWAECKNYNTNISIQCNCTYSHLWVQLLELRAYTFSLIVR